MKRLFFLAIMGLSTVVTAHSGATAQSTPQRSPTAGCSESGIVTKQLRCFLDAAEANGDVGLCEGAYDFAMRFNCVSLFAEHSGDPVSCERIPIRNNRLLAMRDACVSGVAVATKMPELCAQVQLDVMRDACFLIQVVEHSAASTYCDRITRTAVRKSCLQPPAGRQ